MIWCVYKKSLSQTEHKVKAQFLVGGNDHILTQREMLMFPSDFLRETTVGIKSPISWAKGPAQPTSQQGTQVLVSENEFDHTQR